MAVLFVFVDGIGAGSKDPNINPLARGEFLLSRFADGTGAPLPGRGRAVLADALLGVSGRPQSATGQATILTGVNAPALLGRHLVGFPNAALRELIRRESIFRTLANRGRRALFANAYPVAYLRAVGEEAEGENEFEIGRRRPRPSASTVAFSAGGGSFFTLEDARRGRALTHDITGERVRSRGYDLPTRTPEDGAAILRTLMKSSDFLFFEFFETDEAGHAQSMEQALDALHRLDGLLRALVSSLASQDSLIVASDHGNLEDLSSRNHTRARVPVLAFGRGAEELDRVRDLTELAPLLLALATTEAT